MAVQTIVISYSDEQVDRQVDPPVWRVTANFVTEDPAIPDAEVGKVQITLLFTDSLAQQVVKIKNGVRDHILNVLTRPDLTPPLQNGTAVVRVPQIA